MSAGIRTASNRRTSLRKSACICISLQALAPQEVEHEPLSPEQQEEYERRAKDYSRRKMAEERAWQRDLTRKIKLKVVLSSCCGPGSKSKRTADLLFNAAHVRLR